MKFQPKTEAEIAESNLWPAGEYDFGVIDATEKVSKSGNPMVEVGLAVYNEEGQQRRVTDYLMEAMAFKLRHFCEAVGLLHEYEAGMLDPDALVGKTGRVVLKQDPARDGYNPKNSVKDYVVGAVATKRVDLDDELPW